MNLYRRIGAAALALVLSGPLPSLAASPQAVVAYPERADTSRPLRDIIADQQRMRPNYEQEQIKVSEVPNRLVPDSLINLPRLAPEVPENVQTRMPATRTPAPGVSFDGFTADDNVAIGFPGVAPPDTNGDVGLDWYIHYNNLGWKMFSKDGLVSMGPFAGNTFWAGFGGICESQNRGDPIVLYDRFADRWFFAQFGAPVSAQGVQCIAVSQTSDPLGPYNRYEYAINGLDYPKMGVWTDDNDNNSENSSYTLITNNFPGGTYANSTLAVIDRDAVLNGDPTAAIVRFDVAPSGSDTFFATMPGNLEGANIPPAGTCVPFAKTFDDDVWGGGTRPNDGFMIFEICPDFVTPGSSALNGPTFVDAGVDWDNSLCGFGDCIAQPGTIQTLDTLTQFTMFQANVTYDADHAPGELRMVLTSTVNVDTSGGDRGGVQWAELEITSGANASVIQQGVFAPADGDSRIQPSAAMDAKGNIGIVYTKSSATTFPSVYYNLHQQGTDGAGMLQAEASCIDGGGSQTGTNRWGDYASMNIDPVDACTFWMTHEYYSVDGAVDWDTRVCSFVVPSCLTPQVFVRAQNNEEQLVCAGDPLAPIDLDVSISTGATDDVDLSTANVPANFTVNVAPMTVSPTPGTAQVTGSVGGAVTSGDYTFDVVGMTADVSVEDGMETIDVTVFDAIPTAVALNAPLDGTLDASLAPTFSWNSASGAVSYRIEVATDMGFGNIVINQTQTGTTFTPATPLTANTQYFWRVFAVNPCGDSMMSSTFTFTTFTPGTSFVLLVDDDDNAPDVRSFFTDALDALGIPYDVFDTNLSAVEPDLATLSSYESIVWFSGDQFSFGAPEAGPNDASETELGTYLDGGGCLLLSSQDYFFDQNDSGAVTNFMMTYLGLSAAASDVTQTAVTGTDLFSAIPTLTLDYASAGLSNFSDDFTVNGGDADAAVAFVGNVADAAVSKDNGTYVSTFLGFPFPALPTASDRADVLEDFLIDACQIFDGAMIGMLEGTVTINGTGTPIEGAQVSATRGGSTLTTTTDASGGYSFPTLLEGFYQVEANAPGATSEIVQNVQIVDAMTETQDFMLDAGELAYDNSLLTVTLSGGATMDSRMVTINNVGSLPFDYTAEVSGYGVGLPTPFASIISGHRGSVGRITSTGAAAALEAGISTPRQKAAGDVLFSAPFPPGSPLGMTMSSDGTIWVADLFSGETVVYDVDLNIVETIDDPIGPQSGSAATTGVAYDTARDTLWWINDSGVGPAELVEGFRDGTPTGSTVTLPASGLRTGLEYHPGLDAFFYLDIAADDIWAVDRTGAALVGYPAPQTDYDDGAGLFGNGLDIVDDKLEVLVGLSTETQTSRSVVTDRFGNNLGLETSVNATGDTFINDVTRSRVDPDGVLYLAGNSTNTIYAIEPAPLGGIVAEWAFPSVATGTIPGGMSEVLTIDYDASGLDSGSYQATLVLEGDFANSVAGKPLGLTFFGIVPQPATGMQVTESGTSDTFTVVLGVAPTNDVLIPITSLDESEAVVDKDVLRFTPANFNVPQTVTITGVDDNLDDGNQLVTIELASVISSDTNYSGVDPVDATVLVIDNAMVVVENVSGTTTGEDGAQVTFDVVLSDQPTADVTVDVSSTDTSEGDVDSASLTFTMMDWDQPQTVTVTGADDSQDDGDVSYQVTFTSSSADGRFEALAIMPLSLVNVDDELGLIDVNPMAGLTVDESGTTASFNVVLAVEPNSDVFVPISSSDPGEGSVSTPLLTFTAANFNTPQTVTITGVDDGVQDGDQAFTIVTGSASSSDPNFSGVDPADVSVTNTDNDTVSVVVNAGVSLTTTEDGATAQFTVALSEAPSDDVEIAIASDTPSEGIVGPGMLTFTSANFDTPQTVTVSGVNDFAVDGDQMYQVTLTVSSLDTRYDALPVSPVNVVNLDNDPTPDVVFSDGFEVPAVPTP